MTEGEFTLTSGLLSREAEVTAATVRLYEKLGLIRCKRSSDGRRLFQASAIAEVRAIHAERLAKVRGRR
jgi:DNA-binding transcriptional MerR regulator